jgi:hypothetical protein
MTELYSFKKEIYKYALICALIFELVSLLIFGPGIEFAYGLCMGTLVAVANFSSMAFVFNRMLTTKKIGISILGYIIRLSFCAAAVLAALQIGKISALGAIAGLLTIKAAIFYLHGIKKRL